MTAIEPESKDGLWILEKSCLQTDLKRNLCFDVRAPHTMPLRKAAPDNKVSRVETGSAAGYSGTPLSKKLGIKEEHSILLLEAPKDYVTLLEPLPANVQFASSADSNVDIVQVFVTQKEALAKHLSSLRKKLKPEAALWVSWPKKASKVPTTVTEDTIRELALPLGFVDIKVCAVTEIWSGLKLVVRKELR